MELNKYLEKLEQQIRNKKAKAAVTDEIKNHIEDQARFYESDGMTADDAMEEAVKQMGDPVEVGIEMDRIHRPKPCGRLILMAVIMSAAGLLTQYLSFYRFGDELMQYQIVIDYAFERQCIYVLMGTVIMLAVFCLDYSMIGKYGKRLGFLLLAALTVICFYAPYYNGGHSYMKSLIYLFIPIYAGILYQNRKRGYYGIASSLLWLAAAYWVGITRIGGGMGITVDMVCICYLMLLAASWNEWFQVNRKTSMIILAGILPVTAALGFFARINPYQLARLRVMLHPEQYAQEAGYQAANAREAVRNLTLFGAGTEKLDQLPSHTLPHVQYDFIMLQTASIYGILTATLLIGLLGLFLFYLYRMIHKQKNQLGKMAGYGCTMVLTVEMIRSLLNNFGFFTISTGGLPFFSYGRSHTITIYALLGVIFSIYRYQNLTWERKTDSKKQEKGVLAQLGKYRIRIERCR